MFLFHFRFHSKTRNRIATTTTAASKCVVETKITISEPSASAYVGVVQRALLSIRIESCMSLVYMLSTSKHTFGGASRHFDPNVSSILGISASRTIKNHHREQMCERHCMQCIGSAFLRFDQRWTQWRRIECTPHTIDGMKGDEKAAPNEISENKLTLRACGLRFNVKRYRRWRRQVALNDDESNKNE